MGAPLELNEAGQRRRDTVWRALALLAAAALIALAARSTQPRLATANEVNTVAVAEALAAVVQVSARLRPELVGPGESAVETGSGFFVERGLIVTNAHVVAGATTLRVALRDGRELAAVLAGQDTGYDLALLRVSATGIAPLRFADTHEVGQKVVVLGEPLGHRNAVAVGTLSNVAFVAQDNADGIGAELPQVLLTDAQVLPGNSGGPALDSRGRVLGVVAAQLQSRSSANALGLAIPYWSARAALRDLERYGRARRASLGVRLLDAEDLSPLVQGALRLGPSGGALVLGVDPESPAERAGLRGSDTDASGRLSRPGDVILSLDGAPILGQESLLRALSGVRSGQTVTLRVLRGGARLRLRVRL